MSNILVGTPIDKQSAAGVSNLVVRAVPGSVNLVQCNNGASAGYLMVFNAAALPGNGAVTPLLTFAMAANATFTMTFDPPVYFSAGCVLGFSTTGPNTLTASATSYFVARNV